MYPYVANVLGELRDRGTRLGIISDRGPFRAEDVNQALAAAGLLDFFEPELVIYGRKDSPRIFEQAVGQAGAPERVLFVGEDPNERAHALQAGLLVAPHPHLAIAVLEDGAPSATSASQSPTAMLARTGGPHSETCHCCPST